MQKIVKLVTLIMFFHFTGFQTMAQTSSNNPLLQTWTGPYGGVPPWDKVKLEDFPSAFEVAMNEQRTEINSIKTNPAPANFVNVHEAMQLSGQTLDRLYSIWGVQTENLSNENVQKMEMELSKKLAAFSDEITFDSELFKRYKDVYQNQDAMGLNDMQKRLVKQEYESFVRNGALLDFDQKKQLGEINQELASLFTQFSAKVLADEEKWIEIDNIHDLNGLPKDIVESMAASAIEKKIKAKWIIMNTRSSVEPVLTLADSRSLRERVFKMFSSRGDNKDENDTNETIAKILDLRQKRALLLGFKTHAHFRMANTMAKEPQNAMDLMLKVWPAALERVKQEVADMQQMADELNDQNDKITIEAWDYRYYAEKVRKARFDVDSAQIKPYFELNNMVQAAFYAAEKLYDLKITPTQPTYTTKEIPVFDPQVTTYNVMDAKTNQPIGLFYLDNYARAGKRSGAWMTTYRMQQGLGGDKLVLASNNNNFMKGKPGEPVLIALDDATTLFHEFGHAIHYFLQNVYYPSLANTPRDFVEYPSQVNENWLLTNEILDKFARHYQTNEKMPPELLEKILNASKFNTGFSTVEYLSSAILDMLLHNRTDAIQDPRSYEKETLETLGMPKEMVMRHRLSHFNHLFSSDAYSAGYYSYLWSEVMDADTWSAFEETGDVWNKELALKFKKYLLSTGNETDRGQAYRNFRGKDPDVKALFIRRGFPVQ